MSRTAEKEKPTRPITGYFRYRLERLKEMDVDDKNRSKKIKIEWDELDEKKKEKYSKEFKKDMEKYYDELDAWEKKHGITKKSKSKNASAKKNKDRERSASAKKKNKAK
jgi:hypothetical protein